jgi:hypothetical protein
VGPAEYADDVTAEASQEAPACLDCQGVTIDEMPEAFRAAAPVSPFHAEPLQFLFSPIDSSFFRGLYRACDSEPVEIPVA